MHHVIILWHGILVAGSVLIGLRLAMGPTARIDVDGADLTIRLGVFDKIFAVRGDGRVPLASVQGVEIENRPYTALGVGIRARGNRLPGVFAYGTFRHIGCGRDFAALVHWAPAVVITASDDARYERLLVSVRNPGAGRSTSYSLAEMRG